MYRKAAMLDENGEEVPDINKDSESGGDKKDNRFKDLADKVKSTSEERDVAKAEAEAAKKDAEFYKGFSTISSKYQGATEYQEKIREKVAAGYDLEDATTSILIKEGKFVAPQQAKRESPAGGSATTAMRNDGEKSVNEMTHAEKREALEQMERESGAVSNFLKRGI